MELLLELYGQEIPARMQKDAMNNLAVSILTGIKNHHIQVADHQAFVTPNRLIFRFTGLAEVQDKIEVEKKGPRVSAPEQAINGFLKSLGGSVTIADCQIESDKKGEYYVFKELSGGASTKDLLPEIITDALLSYKWAKSMMWGGHNVRWVRPISSIVALFNSQVLDFNFVGVTAGNQTKGHRFLAPEYFPVTDFNDYQEKLSQKYVIIESDKRLQMIKEQSQELVQKHNLDIIQDNGLFDELAGIVEYPNTLLGNIDDKYMSLPKEVIVTSLKNHQKYICTQDKSGKIGNKFIVVANNVASDSTIMLNGYEKVLKARLSDAVFFWQNDIKKSLDTLNDSLLPLVFHTEIGTYGQRLQRFHQIAKYLTDYIKGTNEDELHQAIQYCKADLSSEMVFEFTELQGIMGGYYVKEHGASDIVANAITEHYGPKGNDTDIISEPTAVITALVEKIDMLSTFWLIDRKPTGSKDPYALRRCALGVIRLLLDNKIDIDLVDLFKQSLTWALHDINEFTDAGHERYINELSLDIVGFIIDRLQINLNKNLNIDKKHIYTATKSGGNNIVTITNYANFINENSNSDEFIKVKEIFDRSNNILQTIKDYKTTEFSSELKLLNTEDNQYQAKLISMLTEYTEKNMHSVTLSDKLALLQYTSEMYGDIMQFFENSHIKHDDLNIRNERFMILNYLINICNRIIYFENL